MDANRYKIVTIRQPTPAGWFNIRLLLTVGLHAAISKLIGSHTARRETLAALDDGRQGGEASLDCVDGCCVCEGQQPGSNADELWIDYVADIGDGFNATHSIAWLIGRDTLFIDGIAQPSAQPVLNKASEEADPSQMGPIQYSLPAGRVTIFGGDQVYPYASPSNYRHRTYGPYYAARPWGAIEPKAGASHQQRALFVLPGNHDWYDGLSSFVSNFCQPGRWIGTWQIQQKRSYFSLRLPHGFRIWGIDMASHGDIDSPQLAYFKHQASKLEDNDRVILCVPSPAWTELDSDSRTTSMLGADTHQHNGLGPRVDIERDSWDAWGKIECITALIDASGAEGVTVPLMLSGDHHHYARHSTQQNSLSSARHFITCGGGGAFMLGTQSVPETIQFANGEPATLGSAFPSQQRSRSMRFGVWKLFHRYKIFSITFACVMFGLVWLLNAASRLLINAPGTQYLNSQTGEVVGRETLLSGSLLSSLRQNCCNEPFNLMEIVKDIALILIYQPSVLLVVAGVLAGFCIFAHSSAPRHASIGRSMLVGTTHFLLQLLVTLIITGLVSKAFAVAQVPLPGRVVSYLLTCLLVGWLVHGLLLSAYLRLSNLLAGYHDQEIFSSQAIEDWKCFLRLHICREALTIYPIGLRAIQRHWKVAEQVHGLQLPGDKSPSLLTKIPGFSRLSLGKSEQLIVGRETTHLFSPKDPLMPELIEEPIRIPSKYAKAESLS